MRLNKFLLTNKNLKLERKFYAMKGKKAQVVIFVILGIVILGAVLIWLFLMNNASKQKKLLDEKTLQTEAAQLSQVNTYLDSCLEVAAKDSIYGIMYQGGYDELPSISLTTFQGRPVEDYEYIYNEYVGAPYYIVQRQKNLPTIEEIQESIAERTKIYFADCVNNFSDLETTIFEFEENSQPTVTVEITNKNIIFNLNYEVKAKTRTAEYNLGPYKKLIEYDLISKYNHVKSFIDEQENDLQYIDVGYLSWLSHKEGFEFEIWKMAEKTYAFNFIYEDYQKMYINPLNYVFIVEYV